MVGGSSVLLRCVQVSLPLPPLSSCPLFSFTFVSCLPLRHRHPPRRASWTRSACATTRRQPSARCSTAAAAAASSVCACGFCCEPPFTRREWGGCGGMCLSASDGASLYFSVLRCVCPRFASPAPLRCARPGKGGCKEKIKLLACEMAAGWFGGEGWHSQFNRKSQTHRATYGDPATRYRGPRTTHKQTG